MNKRILLQKLDEIDSLKDARKISQAEHDRLSKKALDEFLRHNNKKRAHIIYTGFFDQTPEL